MDIEEFDALIRMLAEKYGCKVFQLLLSPTEHKFLLTKRSPFNKKSTIFTDYEIYMVTNPSCEITPEDIEMDPILMWNNKEGATCYKIIKPFIY